MIHLLEPPKRLLWSDQFHDGLIGTLDPDDVEDLEWQDESDLPVSRGLIEAAFRHGTPCRRGIIIPKKIITAIHSLRRNGETHEYAQQVEKFHGVQYVDGRRFTDATDSDLQESVKSLSELVAGDRIKTIERYWVKIGGEIPPA